MICGDREKFPGIHGKFLSFQRRERRCDREQCVGQGHTDLLLAQIETKQPAVYREGTL
jgi:hypothetical protein